MTTKKLIVEVEVQNHPEFKKQMDEVKDMLLSVGSKYEKLTTLTNQNAASAVKAYEHLANAAKDREKQLSGELTAEEKATLAKSKAKEAADELAEAQRRVTSAERARVAAVTQLTNQMNSLIGSGTKMLRSFALMTAANEEDSQAMIKRIAMFESMVQGVQGVA